MRGLSPRVRGNLQPIPDRPTVVRSIPACAGEPVFFFCRNPPPWVYPRVCGGTQPCHRTSPRRTGLSPRVRGNLRVVSKPSLTFGSIPACAGEPRSASLDAASYRVYPRVCGGTLRRSAGCAACWGLSPRVRGNHSPRKVFTFVNRVYPRVCGGTVVPRPCRSVASGLSPRVRGNPGDLAVSSIDTGSIPACAGEPSPESAQR